MSRYWLKTLMLRKHCVAYYLNPEARGVEGEYYVSCLTFNFCIATGGAIWTDRQTTRLVPQLFALIQRNIPKKIINVISNRCVKHFYRVTFSSVMDNKHFYRVTFSSVMGTQTCPSSLRICLDLCSDTKIVLKYDSGVVGG
jgi:hypothetical protein